jgi:hypothetical protein
MKKVKILFGEMFWQLAPQYNICFHANAAAKIETLVCTALSQAPGALMLHEYGARKTHKDTADNFLVT